MINMRMERNTVKQIEKYGIRKRVCVREREGGKEMAVVFKQKGKAKDFGEL